MSKRSLFTNITPLPAHVSRETAVRLLHDHAEMIRLNPLVIGLEPTAPPPNATPEEAKVMSWYSITDEIVYVGNVKGETTYKAGFYDLPTGLQTHVFAPAGVDIRAKWSVGGTLPGEQKESVELGLNAPREGLYFREDVDLRCSVFVMNFVKRNMRKGHLVLRDRLVEKAVLAEGQRRQESVFSSDADSILHRWDHLYASTNSRAPTESTRSTSCQSTPIDTSCACEGVNHEPNCPLNPNPGQPSRLSNSQFPQRQDSTVPPSVDLLLGQRRTAEHRLSPAQAEYSAAGPHPCGCAGSVHAPGCAHYLNAMSPSQRPRSAGPDILHQRSQGQQQPYQLSLPTSADGSPLSAHPRTNIYSFSKPQSPNADIMKGFSGHTFRPQRPGEQAELPATIDTTIETDVMEDAQSAIELRPEPLMIRTRHGHAVVMELDGETDIARQYWSHRLGGAEGMANG